MINRPASAAGVLYGTPTRLTQPVDWRDQRNDQPANSSVGQRRLEGAPAQRAGRERADQRRDRQQWPAYDAQPGDQQRWRRRECAAILKLDSGSVARDQQHNDHSSIDQIGIADARRPEQHDCEACSQHRQPPDDDGGTTEDMCCMQHLGVI